VKHKDLIRKLKKAGWEVLHGAKHDIAKHPNKQGIRIPIPRHTEINEYTANQILKEAGLE
jgi:predicted RNA binding protein YcfA (HicA-like mRNA interferase family)